MSNPFNSRHRDSPSQTSSSRDGQYRPSPSSHHHSSSSRNGSAEGPSSRPSRQQLRNLQTVAEMTKDPNQTERPPTGAAPLGLPDRTILEGFEPPTRPTGHSRQGSSRSERNNRPGGNSRPGGSIRQESSQSERNDNAGGNSRPGSSRQNPRGLGSASEYERSRRSQPAAARSSGFVSRAPSHARSLFINQSEAKMASRQTQYESLPPEQRAKQETWAQSFLKREALWSFAKKIHISQPWVLTTRWLADLDGLSMPVLSRGGQM